MFCLVGLLTGLIFYLVHGPMRAKQAEQSSSSLND